MNILIIEDEPHAAQRLENLIKSIHPDTSILASLDSVSSAVQWLSSHPAPDLIMMDIQLADGISFLIFEQCRVTSPVIFTTAYDAYALKAFKVNSIDYILKPVDKAELEVAFAKLKNLLKTDIQQTKRLVNIEQAIAMLTKKYKTRFVIKVGEHLRTIEIDQILYFYSQDKATFCHTSDDRNLILDYSLEELETMVDPALFFRVNRKYLIAARAVDDIIAYSNSRLKLVIKRANEQDIIVARERVQEFKAWLDR